MFDYFRNGSYNAYHVYCGNSPAKGLYNLVQYEDLALSSRSQLHLKLDNCLTISVMPHLGQYLSYDIQTWYDVRLMHEIIYNLMLTGCP